ncbi:hypothetical protein KALB_4324 [Kutzneria albida DSM 43870]|uniref:Uncharacterized protein n=1 Tax=Kutzneria albida DSM 43870 TaxID=1449976 RepID=W5WB06_9PSEU|nr:hypothetical protein KALB_4324 [Kutzneria albida DSM 43870]
MRLGPKDAAAAVERHPCPQCDVPVGSACRTRAGKTAAKYHTARFILVPALRDELTVPVPADRAPGKKGAQGAEVAAAAPETTGAPIRIGYARCSTATQELQSQLDALAAAKRTRVFSEKISTRIKFRPELEKALTLAHEIKTAAPDQPVILTVHEMTGVDLRADRRLGDRPHLRRLVLHAQVLTHELPMPLRGPIRVSLRRHLVRQPQHAADLVDDHSGHVRQLREVAEPLIRLQPHHQTDRPESCRVPPPSG